MSEQIDNVDCTGTESKLSDCHYDTNNLESYYSVGVTCQDGKCEVDTIMSKFSRLSGLVAGLPCYVCARILLHMQRLQDK